MTVTSVEQHRRESPESVRCMIISISDTRTPESDKSGMLMRELLEREGYMLSEYRIVQDDYEDIQGAVRRGIANESVEVILLNGGTGIAMRDTTYEAVRDMLDKEMHGFGELFRYLSYAEDVGTASILDLN
jgi:molybdopterin adenylyltransferase